VCGFIFQGLRRHLLEELEQTFPDEVESYREIRAASAAVSNVSLNLQFLRMIFSTDLPPLLFFF
jgi:site-specific DNA-adenine methylase